MKRIHIFNKNFKSLADTESGIPIGFDYVHLIPDQLELHYVFQGHTASSVLFTGLDDRLYKSGYAPLFNNGKVFAAVRVEGSAKTLESIEEMRRSLLTLGVLAVLVSVLLAIIFSNRITKPL